MHLIIHCTCVNITKEQLRTTTFFSKSLQKTHWWCCEGIWFAIIKSLEKDLNSIFILLPAGNISHLMALALRNGSVIVNSAAGQHASIEKPFCCPRCSKRYQYLTTLKRHLRHECGVEKRFPCAHCEYRARRSDLLLQHVRHKHSRIAELSW